MNSGVPLSGMHVPIGALQPVSKRSSFLYLEHVVVHRDSNAIVAMNDEGNSYIPAASIGVLLLGPGSRVTHQAMMLLGESGVVVSWVGEGGGRLYAWAPSLAQSSRLLEIQAKLFSNRKTRLEVARKMYQMRFPSEDVSSATMQQLRGMEGARIRRMYRTLAAQFGVQWRGRHYDPSDNQVGDTVNKCLSIANSVLYGVAHTAIVAIGCSPGLGFVHIGHLLSFVYDIGDLYKAEISFPAAFQVAANEEDCSPRNVRSDVRRRIYETRLLERIVDDIHFLFGTPSSDEPTVSSSLQLIDDISDIVPSGINYSQEL
jgi:CRISPR-associated protein Cas1